MKTLLKQRREQLVELLGEDKVRQMEKVFDDYLIYGVREAPSDNPPRGVLNHGEGAT